jgi:subtilisin family serine protease
MRRRVVFFAVLAMLAGLLAVPATAANGNAQGPRIDGVEAPGKSATAPGHDKTAEISSSSTARGEAKTARPVNESKQLKVNVLLSVEVSDGVLAELGGLGKVISSLPEIKAVFMQIRAGDLDALEALPYVVSVGEDAERTAGPTDAFEVDDFSGGLNSWDLDAINVTDFGTETRQVDFDGDGVYVAVLDTGLVSSWPAYFPSERIAAEYAITFGGGGAVAEVKGEMGNVSTPPNKWQQDTDSHGTHVTSTILGYRIPVDGQWTYVNGVAPMATVIPVKVLNNSGGGWSSTVAAGIMHVAKLKEGPLSGHPVVINMSLGGSVGDAVEKAAIEYAVEAGVIIVASAGNSGEAGMGYPGAYEEVISVAASGWTGEWTASFWWRTLDVPDPTDAGDYYITDFSSRELSGQDLDVAAPGSWVVGPYNVNQGQLSWFYLGGTSMASPHVAGIVALMAEKDPSLDAARAEDILEGSALSLAAGCRDVSGPSGAVEEICWETDATGAGLVTADAALAATP